MNVSMKTALLIAGFALVATAVPVAVIANHPDGFGMPDQALFGLCTAWANNEKGRENGNAGDAPPFHWLQEQAEAADQTVEEYCAEVSHPRNNGGNGNGGNGNGNGNGGNGNGSPNNTNGRPWP